MILAGGGVRYSLAEREVLDFARRRGIPVAETIAGKGTPAHGDPLSLGVLGVPGTAAAMPPPGGCRHGVCSRNAATGFHHRVVDRVRARNTVRFA
ncbi:hypothetical protein [Mesorhizobium shangrilense]|uniref:Thiamine pyrophosphate enzyme central domain-containing protein n=1 Tax=Mesorhizobium shangrilense TaxID=460060 RepID=A0ABV2DM66_9HYPH